MEDFFVSIAAKIAEYAVLPILHHAQYLCCFHNFASNLPNAKEQLELTQDSVKKQIKEAINRTEKVEPTVEKWLEDVEKVLDEVRLLEVRVSNINKSYFKRQCQYSLAKEIARKTTKMIQLNRNSKFEPFSMKTELPGVKYYSSKDFVMFKSTEESYNKLLEALNKSVSMIGLVGLGGSGKTTLAKEVGKKAREIKLFEKVVMATVSQSPNIRSIQDQIANQLTFESKEASDIGRAQRLSERLRKGTTLLILDDVWEKLNFEALGIPFDKNSKACCVILTTRSREVCTSMQCQSIIELMTNKEPWTLFSLYANITDNSSEVLKGVAREIVSECDGSSIAIMTVGSTLRGETVEEFKLALSTLENSKRLLIPKGLKSHQVCLKLSYDNLKNQLAKSLLLLCSMFPKNYEIDLEDLFRFGRGLGIIWTFGTMEKERRVMHAAINILKNSCLLMHVKEKEKVKMHDSIRDVALWIAAESDQAILTCTAVDPRVLVNDEIMKDKKVIALWNMKNGHLNDELNYPSLEILLIHSPEVGFTISNACLVRLKMLKLLAFLTFEYRWKLPLETESPSWYTSSLSQSIDSLKNLNTLSLRGYKLGDISILGSLQALEILDLRGSSFEELPNGIVALKKLKLLDLYSCWIEKNNAYEVVGRCLRLEELYLYMFPSEKKFPHDVSFSRLQRYVIIHYCSESCPYYMHTDILEKHRPSKALCIDGFNASTQPFISLPIKDLFLRAVYLHLKYIEGGYKNVIPSMRSQGVNQIIALILEYCLDIDFLFDGTIITNNNVDMLHTKAAFSNLGTVRLYHMHGLQEVFHDPSSQCSLEKLEELIIDHCKQLYNISFPRNSNLCSLKVLRIGSCPMLTSIFIPSIAEIQVFRDSSSQCSLENLQELIINNCKKLYSVSFPRNSNLCSLKELRIISCPMLTCLFMPFIGETLKLLEVLQIYECSELMHVIAVEEGNDDYVGTQNHTSFMLPKLRIIDIEGCNKLKYIVPVCFGGLPCLERLITKNCHKLKYVFGTEKEHHLSMYHHYPDLLNLESLILVSLPNLVDIWPAYCRPRLPNLKELQCTECPTLSNSSLRKMAIDSGLHHQGTAAMKKILDEAALKFTNLIFSHLGVQCLFQFQIGEPGTDRELSLKLSTLVLLDLPMLKFIWKSPTNFLSLQLLQSLCVDRCPKLKSIFSPTIIRSLPVLRQLEILNCEELEQIFDSGDAQELKSLFTCSQQVCFPKLQQIKVQKCNLLKFLFYNFEAGHFPSLLVLKIQECSQIEKVFSFECEADIDGKEGTDKDREQVLLQNLRNITLTSLPNFKEIHHGFKLKDHVEQIIQGCPQYSPIIGNILIISCLIFSHNSITILSEILFYEVFYS